MRKLHIFASDAADFAQMADWEDIRHFLAVAQTGSLSGAARSLEVDHATVSRRLAALDVRLVDRLPRSCRLTAIGRQVFEQALEMDASAHGIARLAKAAHAPLVGRVTLSAPPVLVAHLLAEHLARFRAEYPDIRLSLSAQGQQVSLSRREADVAVRLVQPDEAGSVTRKVGTMAFGVYAHRSYAHLAAPERWQFIAFDQSFADMPQQLWLLGIAGDRPVACELNHIGEL
jgi:DNA-binding transcriptional LysR family regulator